MPALVAHPPAVVVRGNPFDGITLSGTFQTERLVFLALLGGAGMLLAGRILYIVMATMRRDGQRRAAW
ncbi:hypothetical protein Q5752_003724 [Cryptotrichosporon argae]